MRIDGKEIANKILLELKTRIHKLKKKGIASHLAIILLNKDPASSSYVNQKKLKGKQIGAEISVMPMPQNTNQSTLLKTIEQLNNNSNVHGIIVQRPLPESIDTNAVSLAINPKKDVDGFHPNTVFEPPIALAVLRILDFTRSHLGSFQGETFIKWLLSKKILILGKGETGGMPIIDTFKKMGINPDVIDTKTPNPEKLTKKADIIISAVGKENVVEPEMIKRGVILIGVGIHKGKDAKLHGDYDEEKIKNIASFYTLTPGGVGPINVATLLQNLTIAAEN